MATVAELIDAQYHREGVGLLAGDASFTHREVAEQAAARAGYLVANHRAGVEPHVGVLLDNTPEFLFWLEGAALAGATVVGVNPTRRGAELERDIRHAECELLVTSRSYLPLLDGLDVPPLLVVDGDAQGDSGDSGTDTTTAYADALHPHRGTRPKDVHPIAPIDETTRLLLYFTSGSTGTPKAVTCVQGRIPQSGEVMAERFGLTAADTCYIPMPLFHGNAILANWGPALVSGATVALRAKFSASGFLADVRRFRATYFTYVGRAVSYILATPPQPDDADNTLRVGFGTEAGPVDRGRFEARFGCRLAEGYGSSEGGVNIVAPPGFPAHVPARGNAVGRNDGTLSIIGLEDGAPCPTGEFDADGRLLNGAAAIGELVRPGTGAFTGYWKNPEADAERLRSGVFHTGDLFYADDDGWLYFAARKADKMRVDGENISVALLEAILERWDPVSGVAAYAVPDAVTGDAVMCALVLRRERDVAGPGTDAAAVISPAASTNGAAFDPAAFAAFLAAQPDLGTKMPPRFIRVTGELATTATAKVSRYALRDEGWWRVGTDEVWWRDGVGDAYRLLDAEAVAALRARHDGHGRALA